MNLTGTIERIRRHHAVEHATIHILSARHPKVGLAGHSDAGGFHLYGDVPTAEVESAVAEALQRLRGEPLLAVHPNCGTNVVSGGVLAAVLSLAALSGTPKDHRPRSAFETLPRLLLAGTMAFFVNQLAGPAAQLKLTTLAEPDRVRLDGVTTRRQGKRVVHRVRLTGSTA